MRPLVAAFAAVLLFAGCDSADERTTVLHPLGSFDVDARRDTLAVDLLAYVAAAPAIRFDLERPAPGVWIEGTRLMLAPHHGKTYSLSVLAQAEGRKPARMPFTVVGNAAWCTPLTEGLDPLPYTAGDVVRFSLSARDMPGMTSGTVTWKVLERTCDYGNVRLTFDETHSTSPGTPVRTSVLLPPSGALPDVGAFVSTWGLLPRTFSTTSGTPATVSKTAYAGSGLACNLSATADVQGLARYVYSCSWYRPGMGNGSTMSLTRLP